MTLGGKHCVCPLPTSLTSFIKLDNILNGRYLSLEDNIFVENVIADIQYFVKRGEEKKKSVLIFPPVNNYRRFLIHKVCEENLVKELSTFSIGQGFKRRTVVCFKGLVRKPCAINKSHDQPLQHLGDQIVDTMVVERQVVSPESSSPEHHSQNGSIKRVRAAPAIYRPPAARKLEALSSQVKQSPSVTPTVATPPVSSIASKSERTRSGTRQRRPDLQVYVPRAKRASMIDQNSAEQHVGHHEILSSQYPTCDSKKNTPELPSNFETISVNSNFDKGCQILPLELPNSNCNNLENFKKINIEYPAMKENLDGVVIENSSVNKSQKCYSESYVSLTNDNSNSVPLACERKDIHEALQDRVNRSDVNIGETCELRNSDHSNGNGCDGDVYKYNSNENLCVSKNDTNEVDIVDSKQCVEKFELTNCDECVIQEKEHCDKTSNCIENSVDCGQKNEIILQETNSNEECTVSESKEKENENKITNKSFVSDVLVISDPKPNVQVRETVPKKAGNLDKDNIISKKTKTKHKTNRCNDAEKSESMAASIITSSNTTSAGPMVDVSLNPDECTWDMLFDDNGDCLDPKIMEELTSAVGSVTIKKPQSDYNRFISKPEINLPGGDDEFAHVLEIYNFPPEFKTQDLLSIFSPFKNGGFEVKWVDDTHALGVFSSSRVAADVLAYEHPFVKTRPLSEATPESRIKAKRTAEFLQPYRARPETCVAMARRLVTGALGMRIATSREEREAERRLLKEARDKKRLAAKQQQDAWEGTIR